MLDQLGDCRAAIGQPTDDPEAVDVGEGLVEGTDPAEVLRLLDERGERAADPGGRRGQGSLQRETNGR
jgi:hypothetical protein